MQGSIVESTCNIQTDAKDQSVDLGSMTVGRFIRNGSMYLQPFTVKLQNCSVDNKKQYYQITFDGETEGKYFALNGDIQGVAMQIIDSYGNEAMPGSPLPIQNFSTGGENITFFMRFVGHGELKAGMFTSTILFNLNYF